MQDNDNDDELLKYQVKKRELVQKEKKYFERLVFSSYSIKK